MDNRLFFDTIPEQFDKYRPHYAGELFEYFISKANITKSAKVLEIGPGTGQATTPVLETGCDYKGIELGENLAGFMREKYKGYENFSLVNDDFISHDFGEERFDVIYSAATIQWLPEDKAFTKTFELLNSGGTLAMMFLHMDYKTPQPELYEDIQKVYDEYFKPSQKYTMGSFGYDNAVNYGYTQLETKHFYGVREFTADEYIKYIGTHSDHISLEEPYRTAFFEGIRKAIKARGDRVVINDTYILKTVCKP